MDFFEHQARARRKTGILVVYFVLAVVLIIATVYLAVVGVLFSTSDAPGYGAAPTWWHPDVFAAVSLGTLAVIAVGSLTKIAELSGGGEVVARALGGRPVNPDTRDLAERVLLNVVEEMAIASGTPVPPVFLLENESAINAFAAGSTPQDAVIGITRGAIETLKRDELQGVIAHEFSHILNGDMRLNLRLIGILNGILLLAMIGYFLMRTARTRHYFSDRRQKGGNPLPLLGLVLYVVGYIGIFFGHLIKSAVSRQREFLADASAVQFTRYPGGIAGALRKIGGLSHGSRLETERAEEASHMFFGNGLSAPLFELMSTHPPLAERIRRIDPAFDGKFPEVAQVSFSPEDVVDPHTLTRRRAAPAGVHAAAVAGAAGFARQPETAVAQIGAPRPEHMNYAADLVASLPPEIAAAVHDPLGAVATIYALLVSRTEPAIRRRQLDYLAAQADRRANAETLRILPAVEEVEPEARLALVSLALPTLKNLSPNQCATFREDVIFLIKVDEKVNLFEYAVHRLVLKRLVAPLDQKPGRRRVKHVALSPLLPACGGLLSTLANLGARDAAGAARAFELGAQRLAGDGPRLELSPRDRSGLATLDKALDQLARAAPAIKKRILEASAAVIAGDGRATVEEAELLRVISDALDCPMPPLVESGVFQANPS